MEEFEGPSGPPQDALEASNNTLEKEAESSILEFPKRLEEVEHAFRDFERESSDNDMGEETRSNILEFPRKFEEVDNKLRNVKPELLSPELKEKLTDRAMLLLELAMATSGVLQVSPVVYEMLKYLSPGHSIYDNPQMFVTYITGALTFAGAGYVDAIRNWISEKKDRKKWLETSRERQRKFGNVE